MTDFRDVPEGKIFEYLEALGRLAYADHGIITVQTASLMLGVLKCLEAALTGHLIRNGR